MKRIGLTPQRRSISSPAPRVGSTIFLESDGFRGNGINPSTGNYPPNFPPAPINIQDAILTTDNEYISVGDGFYLSFISEPVITDAVLTTDNEYISVGDGFYLKYISEQAITDAVLTTDGKYISVGNDLYLSFVSEPVITDAILTTDGKYISVDDESYLKF